MIICEFKVWKDKTSKAVCHGPHNKDFANVV